MPAVLMLSMLKSQVFTAGPPHGPGRCAFIHTDRRRTREEDTALPHEVPQQERADHTAARVLAGVRSAPLPVPGQVTSTSAASLWMVPSMSVSLP